MATIELSNGFVFNFNPSNGGSYIVDVIQGQTASYGWLWDSGLLPSTSFFYQKFIKIMKGTIPTDFSTLINASSRSSDILLTFNKDNMSTLNLTTNPVTFSTYYVSATASGTASWFWIGVNSPSNDYMVNQFIGTIGTIGSGADMEVNTTNVIAGVPWRISSGQVQLPTSWTY